MSIQASTTRFLVNRLRTKSLQRPRIRFSRSFRTSTSQKSMLFRDIPQSDLPETNYPPPRTELLTLPHSISIADVHTMIAHFRKLGQLQLSSATRLIKQVSKILLDRPAVGDLQASADSKLTIVGNLHGQFFDLLQIFDLNGFPSPKNRYLFNGGYYGRGWFTSEILFTLFAIEVAQPGSVFFNASNRDHSYDDLDQRDFRYECRYKYAGGDDGDHPPFSEFWNVAKQFSVAHVVQNSIFVSHGGPPCVAVATDRVFDLDYVRALPKAWEWRDSKIRRSEAEIEADEVKRIILNGPSPLLESQVNSFLKTSNLKQIIRSNASHMNGVEQSTDGKVLTLSSAPRGVNTRGAFIRFEKESSLLAEDGNIVFFNNAFDPFYESSFGTQWRFAFGRS